MKSLMIQKTLSAIAIVFGLMACTGPHNSNTGGEAGGGGNTIVPLSTHDEVSQAIDDAHQELFDQFTQSSLELHYLVNCDDNGFAISDKENRSVQKPRLLQILDLFTNGCANAGPGLYSAPKFEEIEARTTIQKIEKGPCQTQGGAHREGAVVRLSDPNSPICLSVELLQRLPKDLMRAQVLGLLAHEYTHKLGLGEEDAILVQKFFISEIANKRLEARNKLNGLILPIQTEISSALKSGLTGENVCGVAKKVGGEIRSFMEYFTFVRDTSFFPRAGSNPDVSRADGLIANYLMPTLMEDLICDPQYKLDDAKDVINSTRLSFSELKSLVPKLIPIQY